MATLIGDGGHARDIRKFLAGTTLHVEHHKDWVFDVDECANVIIGINDPWLRDEVAYDMGVHDLAWVHPDARLYYKVSYGHGTHINYGVTMTRTTLGHHCTVSPGVTICGDVTIGDRCLIGAGSVICDRVTIGNDVTIGAGCIVLPETIIEDGATYVGNPARRIK